MEVDGGAVDAGAVFVSLGGTLSVSNGGTVTAVVGGTVAGSITVDNARFVTSQDMEVFGGSLTVQNNGTATATTFLEADEGKINIVNSGSLFTPAIQLLSNSVLKLDFKSTIGGVANLYVSQSTVDLTAGGNLSVFSKVTLKSGTIDLGSTGSLTIGSGKAAGPGAFERNPLSILQGQGVIIGSNVNNGVVHVGDDPGTLTFVGNYTQTRTGLLQIEIGPTSYSQLIVTGSANLNGTLELVRVQGATFNLGQTYNIINVSGPVTGEFSTVETDSPFVTLSGSFVNGALDVTTAHAPNSFAAVATSANQAAVARTLDAAAATVSSGDLSDGINALSNASPSAVRASFDTLSGEAYGDFAALGVETARFFSDRLQYRMGDVENDVGDSLTLAFGLDGREVRAESVAPGRAEDLSATGGAKPYHVWAEGLGAFGGAGGPDGAHGFSFDGAGLMGGFDVSLSPTWLAGGAFGYAHNSLSASGVASSGASDSYAFALYSGVKRGQLYLNGALGYIRDDETLSRSLSLPGLPGAASGSPDANQAFGSIEAGYNWPVAPQWTASPFLRLDATNFHQVSFSETGAGGFGLNVSGLDASSAWSTLGARLTHQLDLGGSAPLTASVKIGWGHEFGDVANPLTAAFEGAPLIPFTVQAAQLDRDAAVVGASLAFTDKNVTLSPSSTANTAA